ncbi:hypothetical protein H8356DRAFT_1342370 [Neocallimastix lanati (nom. inval.)]|nr:hypothetical protein H8356DRAFT_1342370 [Neocallimastix sp. JGI-2020a]
MRCYASYPNSNNGSSHNESLEIESFINISLGSKESLVKNSYVNWTSIENVSIRTTVGDDSPLKMMEEEYGN